MLINYGVEEFLRRGITNLFFDWSLLGPTMMQPHVEESTGGWGEGGAVAHVLCTRYERIVRTCEQSALEEGRTFVTPLCTFELAMIRQRRQLV